MGVAAPLYAQDGDTSPDKSTPASSIDPREQLPLQLDGDLARPPAAAESGTQVPAAPSIGRYLLSVAVWLVVCLGLIYGLVALMRLLYRRTPAGAASALIEPLTVVPLAPGLALHVVRFHDELLLLAASGSAVSVIERVTDPERVAFFLRALSPAPAQVNPASFGAALRRMQHQLGLPVTATPRLDGAMLFGPESPQAERESRSWLVGDEPSLEPDKLAQLRDALHEISRPAASGESR